MKTNSSILYALAIKETNVYMNINTLIGYKHVDSYTHKEPTLLDFSIYENMIDI